MQKNEGMLAWLNSRKSAWKKLNQTLDIVSKSRQCDLQITLDLVQGHRALARDVSLSRNLIPSSAMTRSLENLFIRVHDQIYQQPHNYRAQLSLLYTSEIPTIFRQIQALIYSVVILFAISGLASWWLISTYPELISLVASEEMIKKVQSGSLWTDGLLNIMPSSVLSLSIMTNNIMVSLFAFAFGALYGLGTIYIIALNGFLLGGVFAFVAQYGLAEKLFEFVIAHGVVELSVICLAGAAGVQLGEALMRPGDRTRSEAFNHAVTNAGKLLMLIVPLLVGAGIIEGYVSPNPVFPLYARIIIGVGYGVIMLSMFTGDFWRLFTKRR